jgi:hypothetical protein
MVSHAAAAVTGTELATIRIPASADSGVATLRVRGDNTKSLILSAGEFVDRSTKEVLPGIVAFEPATVNVKPGQIYDITVTASNILFEGEAEVGILNRREKIGSLVVVRAPFDVTIPSPNLSFRQALFGSGERTVITLRNDARYPYNMRWMMQVGVHRYCGEGKQGDEKQGDGKQCLEADKLATVSIPPKNQEFIEIQPPPEWFHWTGLFSEEEKEATLWLSFPGEQVPKRALKLKANLQGALYPGRIPWIFALLTSGALCALIVQHWPPNIRRKLALREQLQKVQLKINDFSPDIESSLRVLAQVHHDLLDELRRSTLTIMPHYETVAERCSQGIAILEKRVDLIEEIDSVCEKQRVRMETSLPPSQIQSVDNSLRSASEGLRKTQLSEAEFIKIKEQIDQAMTLTEQMGITNAKFTEDLNSRRKSICNELRLFRNNPKTKCVYDDLLRELPGLFTTLACETVEEASSNAAGAAGANTQADSPNLRLSDNLMDYNLLALKICRDYIWLVGGMKDGELQKKLSGEIKRKLVEHLGRQSCRELQEACLLLEQFRQDIDDQQVWETINVGKKEMSEQMYIDYEPVEIHHLQLVQFRIVFLREELNWAAAREYVIPEWDFGDGHPGRSCWMPTYSFPDSRNILMKLFDWIMRPIWIRKVKRKVQVRFSHRTNRTNNAAEQKGNERTGQRDKLGLRRAKEAWLRLFRRTTSPRRDELGLEPAKEALATTVKVRTDPTDDRWTKTFNEIIALIVSILIPVGALVAGAQADLGQNSVGGALTVFLLGFGSNTAISAYKQRISS